MNEQHVLWRRLDTAGHDACRLVRRAAGWRLEGTAAFRHEAGAVSCVSYQVECDEVWRTREGRVCGWVGDQRVDIGVRRTSEGEWLLDGRKVEGVKGCLDLDLGFTPATNLFQLRRMALAVGQSQELTVAWLDIPDGGLGKLAQRYERRAEDEYWYAAPRFDYAAVLKVDGTGFVRLYPRLWVEEAPGR